MTADIRIVPTAALTATTIALAAFVIQYTTAAMWAAVVALVLAVCGLFTLASETIGLRADLDDAERRAEELEAECQRLHLELTEAQIAGGKVLPFPPVRGLVPPQRDDEHDHLRADDDWFARLYDDKGDHL